MIKYNLCEQTYKPGTQDSAIIFFVSNKRRPLQKIIRIFRGLRQNVTMENERNMDRGLRLVNVHHLTCKSPNVPSHYTTCGSYLNEYYLLSFKHVIPRRDKRSCVIRVHLTVFTFYISFVNRSFVFKNTCDHPPFLNSRKPFSSEGKRESTSNGIKLVFS